MISITFSALRDQTGGDRARLTPSITGCTLDPRKFGSCETPPLQIRLKGAGMFFAMNRFQIALGREEVFEKLWKERDSQLEKVPGFRDFHLLRGATSEESTS